MAQAGVALAVLAAAAGARAEGPQRREVGNLVFDGVPPAPADLLQAIRRYGATRVATFQGWTPDGAMLVRTRFGQTPQIHRVRGPGAAREQLTFYDEPVRNAVTSPVDGHYVVTRDAGGAELYEGVLVRPDGARLTITAPRTRNEAFVFSRDGKQIAWAQARPGQADWDVMLMDVDDVASRRSVLAGLGAITPLDFSPDGRRLLIHRNISATASRRYVLDLADRHLREINPTATEVAYAGGKFTADGQGVLTLSDQGSDFTRLVQFDLRSGRQTVLSPPDLHWDVEAYDLTRLQAFDLSRDGRRLVYSINEDGRSHLVLIDLKTRRRLPVPTLPNAIVVRPRFSPDGRRIAMTISTADADNDVWTWTPATRKLERWTLSEMGDLPSATLPKTTLIRFPSFDGRSIPAFVYGPKTPLAGRRPVLILVHGGPEAQMRPAFDADIAFFVAELGATVITPNIRGSTGYGRSFTKLDDAGKREDAVRDIGGLLDWIARQPDLDPGRVVIYGGSYGGYVSLAALANYDDRLAGAIDEVGISNWSSFIANTEGYRRDGRRAEYGDERDPKIKALFDRISPLNMTDRMTKPLLVIQGLNDPRVHYTEAERIVSRLRGRGAQVWYLLAKDEGHGFAKRVNQEAALTAEALFLKTAWRLTPAPAPPARIP